MQNYFGELKQGVFIAFSANTSVRARTSADPLVAMSEDKAWSYLIVAHVNISLFWP